MTNKKIGNDFESQLCELLSSRGFWCHNFAVKKEGQPADIIAVRNGKAHLIDCKVCSTSKGFSLSRVEENQELAMTRWSDCGNGDGWFAFLVDDSVYFMQHCVIAHLPEGGSYISPVVIMDYGIPFDRWIRLCE